MARRSALRPLVNFVAGAIMGFSPEEDMLRTMRRGRRLRRLCLMKT